MITSKEDLLREAKQRHYKPEILEKALRLLDILEQLLLIPYLRDHLALKGGTALNLFQTILGDTGGRYSNKRRNTLPTGDLGSSERNSIYFGRL